MQVGTLVNWNKKVTGPPNPDIVVLPAIINQIWPNGQVSLFVFSFDGAFHARTVNPAEIDILATPEDLRMLGETQRQMVALTVRMLDLERSLGVSFPQDQLNTSDVNEGDTAPAPVEVSKKKGGSR